MVTLIEAAKTGNRAQVNRILCVGRTDINCRDSEKKGTPLFWAANGGHDDIVMMLLDSGADIEIPVNWGMTPLLAAVDRKHISTTRILLNRGADINAQSQNGDTALHLAAYRGSSSLCKLLIDYGASKTFLNNTGKTAQQGAEAASHTSLIKLLAPETNHKGVCRSSSLPSPHRTQSTSERHWQDQRVPSESDDSPFIDDDEEWNSLQRKLAKRPLQHPMTMAIRRDIEEIRYNSAQQLDRVGRVSPTFNQPSIPCWKSQHLHLGDDLRHMRRGSDPEVHPHNRGGVPVHHIASSDIFNDPKQDRRWSPPLHRQHSDATFVRQYLPNQPQRDSPWEFTESSGNGSTSFKTSRQNSKKMPPKQLSAPGYFRRDVGTRYTEPVQNVSNGRNASHRSSPDSPRRSPEMADIYHQQLGASRRQRDEHIQQHQERLVPSGSAKVNNLQREKNVQWNFSDPWNNRDKERQGSSISNKSIDQALQHQRLLPEFVDFMDINQGQHLLKATNGQNPDVAVSDTACEPDAEVRQLHSVIDKLLEDKLSLTEQNRMMGDRLNQLESALDAALAADSSSEESWQTRQESLDSDLVQALARKLDSNLGRSSRLEQLCLKLLNDNQRLHALSASPPRVDNHSIDSAENRVPSDGPFCRRNGQSTPYKNTDLRPPSETRYLNNKSPSDRSTCSSSSLSPTSESSSYFESGSSSDHLASSKKSSGDEECVLNEKTSSIKTNSSTGFSRKCWSSLNSSYPRVAFQSGNITSTAMKAQGFTSQDGTDNIKKVLQAISEKNSDSRGQYTTKLADAEGAQSEPNQSVDILEKLSQSCGADGNISAQFKCVMNKKQCILKVENRKGISEPGCDAVENLEDILKPSPHLHLPIDRWNALLAGEDRFTQQLLVQLQTISPGIQKTGERSSGRGGDGDGSSNDAGVILDKDVFRCAVYPSVQLSLEDLFEERMGNANLEEPAPCTDTGIIRILLQLLLAVEHLHQEGIAHGNIHPGCIYMMEDMRVVLGGLENARWLDARHGKEQHREHPSGVSEVTAGQSSNANGDTVAIAVTVCKILEAHRDSTQTSEKTTRQQVCVPPDWLSINLHKLLTEMLSSDPEKRPPVKSALLRAAAMLYGPEVSEVSNEGDCEEWLISQAPRLVLTAPHNLPLTDTEEPDCADSIHRLDWRLCLDFILRITPQELWQLYHQPAQT